MNLKLIEVLDVGDDVLLARAVDTDQVAPEGWDTDTQGEWTPDVLEATGWVSATTNHYDASAYSEADGDLVRDAKAKPRAMTKAEVAAYALSLFGTDTVAVPVEPTPIAFE